MSTENVRIVLAADVSQLDAGSRKAVQSLGEVETATKKIGTESEKAADKAVASAEKQKAAAQKVGNALMLAGAAAIAASGAAVKAAIDWESAYAGVRKTVDGTAAEMKVLEAQLRGIAKVAPSSHKEIAAVAEAAGQLGVKRADVAKFTKTMIDLGVTTNITAEQGAMSIRQFMNIMGSAPESVDRIASAIVGLGNNSATTENDIMMLAQRLAGAGKQAKMSEAEVLGMSAAMASVGIEAEAGGTAMSLTLKGIDAMVRKGGPQLALLGDIAGVTGEQYAQAWGKSAAGATDMLVVGLGKMMAQGKDVNGMLDDLGFKGIRQTDSLLRLAGATKAMGGEVNLLSSSLKLGAEEFARNTALQEEAQKRYGTTAEKAKIAANQVRDGMIDMGNALLPIAANGIQVISDLAQAFASLPDPVKSATGGIIGLGGLLLLSAGGAIKVTLAFKAAKDALEGMGTSMRNVTLKGGAIGLALAAVAAVIGHFAGQAAEAQQRADSLAEAIKAQNGQLRDQNGIIHESIRAVAAKNLVESGAMELAKKLGVDLALVTEAYLGNADARAKVVDQLDRQMEALKNLHHGESIAQQMANGSLEQMKSIRQAKEKLTSEWDKGNVATNKAIENAKMQIEAQGGVAGAIKGEAEATAEAARKKAEFADEVRRSNQELHDAVNAIMGAANAQRAAMNSHLAANQATLDGKKAVEEWRKSTKNGTSALAENTDAGIKNNQTLRKMGDAYARNIEDMVEQRKGVEAVAVKHGEYRQALLETMEGFNLTGKAAEDYADQLIGVPSEVKTLASIAMTEAQKQAEKWKEQIKDLPTEAQTKIMALVQKGDLEAAQRTLESLSAPRTAVVRVKISADGSTVTAGNVRAALQSAGGIMDYYADGGIRDVANAHVPHIAPPGTWRVFAEPETGGEAYIPLANDGRRPRAQAILRETARRIGVQTFAGGGLSSADSRAIQAQMMGTMPLSELTRLTTALAATTSALDRVASETAKSTLAQTAANAATARAQAELKRIKDDDSAISAAQSALQAAKRRKAGKSTIHRLEDRVASAKTAKDAAVDAAEKRVEAAKLAEAAATDAAKAATERLTEAQRVQADRAKELEAAQKALADSARQASQTLRDAWMTGGDTADLVANMNEGAQLIGSFSERIDDLRKLGLGEDVVQRIIKQGVISGADTAADILRQGAVGINALNASAAALTRASDRLGLMEAIGNPQYGLIPGSSIPSPAMAPFATPTAPSQVVIQRIEVTARGVTAAEVASEIGHGLQASLRAAGAV